MAVDGVNFNTGFPRLVNAQPGMVTNYMPKANTAKLTQEMKPQTQKTVNMPDDSERKKYKKGYILITASAVVALAMIISKIISGFRNVSDLGMIKKYFEKMRPEFDMENTVITKFPGGLKRIDEVHYPVGLKTSKIITNDGAEIVSIFWNQLNEVNAFKIKNKQGQIIKKYPEG